MNEKPDPDILWSWIAIVIGAALPLTIGLIVLVHWLWSPGMPLILSLWGGVLLVLIGVYLPLRRQSLRFSLEQEQITVTTGVLIITTRRMQLNAVRQITVLQGPLERHFGIVYLLVSATGGHLLIEGIRQEQAHIWCQRLHPL